MFAIFKLPLLLFAAATVFLSCKPREYNAQTASKIEVSPLERESLIAQAEVWFEGSEKLVATRDIRRGPEHPFFKVSDQVVNCDFKLPKADDLPGGRTPKFECKLNNGKKIKVKYDPYWVKIDTETGKRSPNGTPGVPNYEVYGEIMATRLMWALGFGADNIYTVRVNCKECPLEPWVYIRKKLGVSDIRDTFLGYGRTDLEKNDMWEKITPNEISEFYPAVIEDKFAGDELDAEDTSSPKNPIEIRGWKWDELYKFMDNSNPEHAKKQKLHREALTILMAFINHYDSKDEQQRLVCLKTDSNKKCLNPFMIVQDAGSNFGSGFNILKSGLTFNKMDIVKWEKICIWDNPAKRIVAVHGTQPNATFTTQQVSEEARAFLANLMKQLTQKQILDLFTEARTDWARHGNNPQSPAKWAEVFTRKMQDQIIDAKCR